MNIRSLAFLFATHCAAGAVGFAGGIYALPILIAPTAPSDQEILTLSSRAQYNGEFRRDLKGSDMLHWGEGRVAVGDDTVTLAGKLAPGPDYKLYLSPEFVETEEDFRRLKPSMARLGDVKTFENFVVDVPPGIDPSNFTTAIVWCESFDQFITSAKYR